MLRMASFPPDRQEIGRWFADHQREWEAGEAYRFAVELEGSMVGVVDVDEIAEREGSLGYWLDRAARGAHLLARLSDRSTASHPSRTIAATS